MIIMVLLVIMRLRRLNATLKDGEQPEQRMPAIAPVFADCVTEGGPCSTTRVLVTWKLLFAPAVVVLISWQAAVVAVEGTDRHCDCTRRDAS